MQGALCDTESRDAFAFAASTSIEKTYKVCEGDSTEGPPLFNWANQNAPAPVT